MKAQPSTPVATPNDRPAVPSGRLRSWKPGAGAARATAFGLGVLALFLGVAWAASGASVNVAPASAGATAVTSASSPATNYTCNAVYTSTPSAIYIPIAVPAKNLTTNGEIVASMEVQVVNYTNASYGAILAFPGIFFKFPLAAGGNFTMFIAPSNFTITGAGWSNPNLLQRSDVVAGGLVFKKGSDATLTTEKVAVMANRHEGQITIEVRWHWENTPPGKKKPISGSWSIPTAQHYAPALPSIFYPAQYVRVVNETGAQATIGSTYNITLAGTVGAERFFLEMEQASGHVVQSQAWYTSYNATIVNTSISMLNYDHYLSPGTYLVHVHDACGALLFNKVVKLVYPPVANVTFYFVPGQCGPIYINGSSYTNGTTGAFQPSPTAYNFSFGSCKGETFSNWSTTGALHIASGHSIVISASGTFTVRYV